MPKRTRVPPVFRPRQRGPSTRWREERRSQLLALGLGAAVILVAAVIALFGYYQTQVRPQGETVLEVGDRSFDLRYMERRLRYDIRNGTGTIYSVDPGNAPDRLVDAVGGEELMRRGAPDKGVEVNEEAIDAEIRTQENVPANADQNSFAAAYRQAVQDSGLSTEGYRDVISAGLLQEALRAKFVEEAPKNADQVRFRLIVLSIENDAKTTLDRLRNGEDFAVVAQEVSEDTASKDQGGERDWTPRGILDPALDEALFSLETGKISEVIPGASAYFIVQVLERQDQRETTAEQQSALGTQAMSEWLRQLRDSIGVTVKLDNDQRGSILKVLQSEVAEGQ